MVSLAIRQVYREESVYEYDIEQAGLVDRLIVIADLLAQLFGFILAIYGRVTARHAIGSK